MPLTQVDHLFLTQVFSDETIREQARIGNITQDDADFAIALRSDTGLATTEQAASMLERISGDVQQKVIGVIDEPTIAVSQFLGGIDDKIKDAIQSVLDPLIDAVLAMERRIIVGVQTPIRAIEASVDALSSGVLNEINGVIDSVDELLNTLRDSILSPILNTLGATIGLINQIDDKVKDVVQAAVEPITATTGLILDSVQGFATALRDTIPELGNMLGGALGSVGDTIGDAVKGAFQGFIDSTGLGGLKAVMDAVGRIPELIDPQGAFSPDLTEKMGANTLQEFSKNPAAMITLVIPFISTLAQIVFAGQVERIQQASRGDHNSGILAVTDMTSLVQRGLADPEDARETAFRSGLNDLQLRHVFNITRQRPGTLDIIDYWRRELITDGVATNRLRDLGWSQDDVNLIKESAFPPPGVQDLIRMAVREVFSPEIAEQFGQFEGQPPKYTEWAKKIGLSEEWARNFWAAHWILPSVQQGFEMLHRSVIGPDDLERLFVALDVMPFWRQPLKDISFRPFTRVDVRRMFALGVLDRPGVLRSYLDLGFAPDKAENMTEFTVRWVESTRKVEKDRERDLTKGDIIGLFNDGLLNDGQAKFQLERMGFDANEAELLIQREVVQELRQDRKADIRLVVDQAKIKVLTFSEAQDRLNGLDLTRREMERALVEVSRSTTERIRLPSKSDLDSWKELDLLSLDQYETELDNLGFPAKYVALYVEAIQLEEAEDLLAAEERDARRVEPRPVTKGQLDSLLRTEVINDDEYVSGLQALRFDQTAIDNFIIQITVQIEETRIAAEERAARGEEAAEREKLLGRVVLGKLVLKEIIGMRAYREGLTKLGFSRESVDLLSSLLTQKLESAQEGEEE